MITLLIQRGGSKEYQDNIQKTIAQPIEISKIDKILDLLTQKGMSEHELFAYMVQNKQTLFSWGNKRLSELIIKDNYQLFIINNQVSYIGKISFTEVPGSLRTELAEILWGTGEEKGKIWFLNEVKKLNISKEELESQYNFNLVEQFGRRNDFNPINDETFPPIGKTNKLISDLLNRGEGMISLPPSTISSNTTKNLILPILSNKKQIIFFGPPGTGKTYYTKKCAEEIIKHGI